MNEAIEKYKSIMSLAEYRMLKTLERYNLLLDFKEEINQFGYKQIVGYNLEREIIFIKLLNKM